MTLALEVNKVRDDYPTSHNSRGSSTEKRVRMGKGSGSADRLAKVFGAIKASESGYPSGRFFRSLRLTLRLHAVADQIERRDAQSQAVRPIPK